MTSQIAAGTGSSWGDAFGIGMMLAWHLRWWIAPVVALSTLALCRWAGFHWTCRVLPHRVNSSVDYRYRDDVLRCTICGDRERNMTVCSRFVERVMQKFSR